jgi:hypothetical protein
VSQATLSSPVALMDCCPAAVSSINRWLTADPGIAIVPVPEPDASPGCNFEKATMRQRLAFMRRVFEVQSALANGGGSHSQDC